MKLLHFTEGDVSNFGDDLNVWMWRQLMPHLWNESDDIYFSGIGTILRRDLMPVGRKWVVMGSGVGYTPPPRDFGGPLWQVLAVRGPLSASILGIDPTLAVTDAAILLASLQEYKPVPESSRSGTVFMPHYQSLHAGNWEAVCKQAGVTFLDPRLESRVVLEVLRHAKLVLADAMHAAIVADTMRVPWVPLVTSATINTFKWLDWTETLSLPYEPQRLPPSSLLEALRDATLGFYGESFYLRRATIQDALRDYRRKQYLKGRAWWRIYRAGSSRILTRYPDKVLRHNILSGWRIRSDENCIAKAAQALRLAAEGSSYLSNDEVFYVKLAEMQNRMLRIPEAMRALVV